MSKNRVFALKSNMNISTYLAAAALDKKIVVIEELKNILPQLRRVGVNLNRLAEKAHLRQFQASKIEQGNMGNIDTFLKVVNAIGMKVRLVSDKL